MATELPGGSQQNGSPEGSALKGTPPPTAVTPESESRINDLMSKWQTTQNEKAELEGTVASLADRLVELESQRGNPDGGSASERAIEAEMENTRLRKENLQLQLAQAVQNAPMVSKGIAAGKINLDNITSVEALNNLEATLMSIVQEINPTPPVASTPTPDVPVTPATTPSPETAPAVPPTAGPMAAPVQDPSAPTATLPKSQSEALKRMVETGDQIGAVREFFGTPQA